MVVGGRECNASVFGFAARVVCGWLVKLGELDGGEPVLGECGDPAVSERSLCAAHDQVSFEECHAPHGPA